jgi:hypothetical protein
VSFSRVDDLVANGLGVPQIIAKDTGTAEAAGQAHTPWYQTGVIGAGAAPTGGLTGADCSATTGNAGASTTSTVSYTNSAGTAGRTATLSSYPITALTGTWQMFSLAAGDDGVRSVQSITLGTSYVSGAIHLVAFRLVAELPTPIANVASRAGFTDLGLPTVWDSSVLQLVYWPTGTALGAVAGSCSYAQG